jgi:hypothetical protein
MGGAEMSSSVFMCCVQTVDLLAPVELVFENHRADCCAARLTAQAMLGLRVQRQEVC